MNLDNNCFVRNVDFILFHDNIICSSTSAQKTNNLSEAPTFSVGSSCQEMTYVLFTRNFVVLDATRQLGELSLSKYGSNLARRLSQLYLIPGFVKTSSVLCYSCDSHDFVGISRPPLLKAHYSCSKCHKNIITIGKVVYEAK